MHVNDDRIDSKQGCGLFFFISYASVSVLHESSMSVNIFASNRAKKRQKERERECVREKGRKESKKRLVK